MINESAWKASKFVVSNGRLLASLDPLQVSPASRLNVNSLAAALQPLVERHAHGHLMDLGCGKVPLYPVYRDRVQSVTCVDWPSGAHGLTHVDVEADLNQPLQFPSNSVDSVLLTDVLEHIAHPNALMAEISRVLVPGGWLVGSVPFLYWLHEEPHDHFRYTVHALRNFALTHRFDIGTLEPYGTGTDVMFDVLGKVALQTHWRVGPMFAALANRLGWAIRSWPAIQRLNARCGALPSGYVFAWRAIKTNSHAELVDALSNEPAVRST